MHVLLAALLPLLVRPGAPFPRIITDAPTIARVAPGVEYGDYEMLTVDGPLSIHVVAVDLGVADVRVGTALAQERLRSAGETVSSMAHRTGAVAGINGDYFDINQTNEPLNILIENGRVVRAPTQRYAFALSRDRRPLFAEFHNGGTLTLPGGMAPLQTINDWPPPGGGTVLITPAYGGVPAAQNTTVLALQPDSGMPPYATYSVRSIADGTVPQPPGYYLAAGTNAYGAIGALQIGDSISASPAMEPPIDELVTAIGGGPLLVKDGAWYADPDGPSTGEFATHMPASGVAVAAATKLLLFEIDGRQPALSIGVLQPQFAALMIAFGAQTGMQLDGGGSSTLVARMPGDEEATVRNSPSDGNERRVADGLFVYNDAPRGPAALLAAEPAAVRAFPGARVPIKIAATDAGGHPAALPAPIRMRLIPTTLGSVQGGSVFAARPGTGSLHVTAGTLAADIPIEIAQSAARAFVLPLHPNVAQGGEIALTARAFDRRGYPLALPARLRWSAQGGTISPDGVLRAGAGDAFVHIALGDLVVTQRVLVGSHSERLPIAQSAAFAAAPRGAPGSLRIGEGCAQCITLHYDFTKLERAAYVTTSLPLPPSTTAISLDVYGDGRGETLRAAVENAIRERFLYTVARVTWRGWRRVQVDIPAALAQPLTLKAIYVIDRVGPEVPVKASGAIAMRDVRAVAAGMSH